ncbi:condensin-2 complex subunit D3-like [Uloborus diversus]|uniref:condensin-2 complex subunit D3-like n=1 Tax=Uloborus diversus TaxID=327109 RepID=UPI00240930FA|nr:condensin-2 complex subunit D3-like [Uloborus diversus]
MVDIRSITAQHFDAINFSELSEDWIDEVTEGEYTDADENSISTNVLFIRDAASCLDDVANVCDAWCKFLDGETNSNDISGCEEFTLWNVLEEMNINIRQVLGLVYLLCYKASKPDSSIEDKELGLKCTKFYFNLLKVPGSAAYSVYHPNLLSLCINCFCVPEIPVENKITSEWKEIGDILPAYTSAIESLIPLLNTLHLGNDSNIIENIVLKLSDLTSFESSSSIDFESLFLKTGTKKRRNSWSYLVASLAYQALTSLTKTDLNGDIHDNYSLILACLRKHILCSKAKKASSIPHKFLVVKDNAVSYMLFNLEQDQPLYSGETLVALKRLCLTVCDKTDFRSIVAQSVLKLMVLLLSKDFVDFIQWLLQLSDSNDLKDRIFALDILSEILVQKPKIDPGSLDEPLKTYLTEMPIIFQVLTRCDDTSAAVRTKALAVLSQNMDCILKFFDKFRDEQWEPEEFEEVSAVNGIDRSFWYNISSHRERLNEIASILIRRNDDSNVHTRKAALQALESLISFDNTYLNEENLKLFTSALSDKNIVVRKQMIQSITAVLDSFPTSSLVQDCWLKSILPLVQDPENTVQVKAFSVIEDYFLCKIFSNTESEMQCALDLLKKLTGGIFLAYQNYVQKSFASWKAEKKLRPQLIMQLEKHLGSENEEIIWFYISMFAAYSDIPSRMLNLVVEVFCKNHESMTFLSSMEYIIKILDQVSKKLPAETLKKLQGMFQKSLTEFSVPVDFVPLYINSLRQINKSLNEEDELQKLADEVVKKSIESLSCAVFRKSSCQKLTEDVMARKLCLIVEMCHFYPSYITENLLLILKAFVSSRLTKANNQLPSISPTLQSHAFAALGKLCLQEESLAKELLPALAKEMLTSEHGVIRSAVVVIMIEMCKRYTSYADKYIPLICLCFKDSLFIVRFQAATMIINLLQEDYIKWKSPLFFCLLSTILDKKEAVQELGKYCLCDLLTKKQPTLFYDRFPESIFVFNCFKPQNNKNISSLVKHLEKFALKGPTNTEKRITLYAFLLQNIPYLKRFCLIPSIVSIFDRIAEGVYPLNEETESIIRDCFMIVTSKELEFHSQKVTPEDSEEKEEDTAPDDLQFVKLVIIEPLMPSILKLYNCVHLAKLKLADDIIPFLTEILQNHKSEVKDILSENFGLLKAVESQYKKESIPARPFNKEDHEEGDGQCQQTPQPRMSMRSQNMLNVMLNGEDSCANDSINNANREVGDMSLPLRKSQRGSMRPKRNVDNMECENASDPSPGDSESAEVTQVLNVPPIEKDSQVASTPRLKASSIPFSSTPRVVLKPLKLPRLQNLSLIQPCDEEDED